MKAANRFKKLLHAPRLSILGQDHESNFVLPPQEMTPEDRIGLHSHQAMFRDRDMATGLSPQPVPLAERGRSPKRADSTNESPRDEIDSCHNPMASKRPSPPLRNDTSSSKCSISSTGTRGHARSPLQEHLYLSIGPSRYTLQNPEQEASVNTSMDGSDSIMGDCHESFDEAAETAPSDPTDIPVVSESPGASDIDIYETAYREQVERIKHQSMEQPGAKTKFYLNRRVERKKHHLTEVLKLVQEAQDASALHSRAPALQIGDRKVPGSTVPAVVSALTAQLAARSHKGPQAAGHTSGNGEAAPIPSCPPLPSSEPPSVPKEDNKTPLSTTIPAAAQPLL
jgi:calcium/calmodulin-dependent protein kinase kinase 2